MNKRFSKKQETGIILQNIKFLQTRFPKAFPQEKPLPLEVGIHQPIWDVIKDLSQMSLPMLQKTLKYYCGSKAYLKEAIAAKRRYNLKGEVSGEMNVKHALYMQAIFKARYETKGGGTKEERQEKSGPIRQAPPSRARVERRVIQRPQNTRGVIKRGNLRAFSSSPNPSKGGL